MPTPTTPATEGKNHVDWIDITDPDPRNLYRRLYRKGKGGHCFTTGRVTNGLAVRTLYADIQVYSPTELARVPTIKALVEAAQDMYDMVCAGWPAQQAEGSEAKVFDAMRTTLAPFQGQINDCHA